jgi:hypothetical protein
MTPIRITLDGRPGAVVGWDTEDRHTVADILLDDGKATWCWWPSPRIEAEKGDDNGQA